MKGIRMDWLSHKPAAEGEPFHLEPPPQTEDRTEEALAAPLDHQT